MWQRVFGAVVLAGAFLSLSGALNAQDKKKPGDIDPSKVRAGKLTGKLKSVPSAGGTMSLEVVSKVLSGGKVVDDTRVVELPVAADPVIRMMVLPPEYDDKGKLKLRTAAELRKLKGPNPSLPGYEAKIDDLQAGMTVTVVLSRPVPKKEDKEAEPKPAGIAVTTILVTNPDAGKSR